MARAYRLTALPSTCRYIFLKIGHVEIPHLYRHVVIARAKTTGYEKLRYAVMLTILADGTKLPPFIIFKNLTKAPKPGL